MGPEYIVVQAGGKGTRLDFLTVNKPKALVPVENLPMLFHLFRLFPEKKFVIIGDYQKEVLREYLSAFAPVEYQLVEAQGSGTCSGVENALALIPDGQGFMLVWSDLILPKNFVLPTDLGTYIGISQSFSCRWSYENGVFSESPSVEHGVAGLFVFPHKQSLEGVPQSGELVRWISEKGIAFQTLGLSGTREFGVLEEYQKLEQGKCRPFNRVSVENGLFRKEAIDPQGEALAERECKWYAHVMEKGFTKIPRIHSFSPLTMDFVDGKNMYQCDTLGFDEKQGILEKIISGLKELHGLGQVPVDTFSLKEAYFKKTMERLGKVRDLIPFASEKVIEVNGRLCDNVFFHKRELELALSQLSCTEFVLLHGDCTFSNIMLQGEKPIFIDPRGYFGSTPFCGDPNYDWAKLYYSIVGNYDRFNLKEFSLKMEEGTENSPSQVTVDVVSNGWESLEGVFFSLSGAKKKDIQLIHAVIWLSLTTYAWEDYDSICGAFYLGLYYLQEALS